MSTSIRAMETNVVKFGTAYVPEFYWPLVAELLQMLVATPTTPTAGGPSMVTGDKESGVAGPFMTAQPAVAAPPTESVTDAAPTTTPGTEKRDAEGGPVIPGASPGTGAAPAAVAPAEDQPPPLPALPTRPRERRSSSRRRSRRSGPSMAEPISSRTINTAERSVMMHAPAPAARCATCGTPGVRTETWVCGVCDEPFILGGQLVVSLDGLDEELAAGGLYCESCGERRPPFERLACTGCSAPARHIGDVLAHNRREQGRHVADAVVAAPVELPDDGITTDPEIEALLPRESSEKYALLEQDLRAHGCVAPLVVWQDGPRQVLLDGHIRHAICRAHHIFYEKKILEFPDRTSAILWVIENQLGRRNLTPEAQAYLRGRIYNLEKRQGARTDLDTSRHSGKKLSRRLADLYRSTPRTIERDGQFALQLDQLADAVGPDIKHEVLTRDAKISRSDVARLLTLEAPIRDHIIARVRDGEKAAPLIKEALASAGASEQPAPPVRTAASCPPVEDGGHGAGEAEVPTNPMQPQGRADKSPLDEEKDLAIERAAEDDDRTTAREDPVTELVAQYSRLSKEDRARFLRAIGVSSAQEASATDSNFAGVTAPSGHPIDASTLAAPRARPKHRLPILGAGQTRPAACRVAYRGPSLLDEGTIRVAVHSLQEGSKNRKLGRMAQVMIAPDDAAPHVAARRGTDRAVCGDCVHRPVNGGTCYTVLPLYFPEIWKRTSALNADLDAACRAIRDCGFPLRIGSWGDPAAVPYEMLARLVNAARGDSESPRHTAYTNSWRTGDGRLADMAMASVLSSEERDEAKSLGYRTFRIRTPDMPVLPGEMICPATLKRETPLTCSVCLACSGAESLVKKDIVVVGHGSPNKIARLRELLSARNSGPVTAHGEAAEQQGRPPSTEDTILRSND